MEIVKGFTPNWSKYNKKQNWATELKYRKESGVLSRSESVFGEAVSKKISFILI